MQKHNIEDKMKRYTEVEALTIMRDGLVAQGKKSLSDAGCALRGWDGAKCAVGMLIDDEHYTKDMEDNEVYGLCMIFADEQLGFNLSEIQTVCERAMSLHDNYAAELWEMKFNMMIEGRQ